MSLETTKSDSEDDLLRSEQNRVLRRGLRSTVVLNLVLAAILVYAHRDAVASNLLWSWSTVMVLTAVSRVALAGYEPQEQSGRRWRTLYAGLTGLWAVVWGAGALLMFTPDSPGLQILLTMAMVSVGTGALVHNFPDWRIVWIYAVAVLAPLFAYYLTDPSPESTAVVLLLALMLVTLMVFSRRISRLYAAQVRLRLAEERRADSATEQEQQVKRLLGSTRAVLWEADAESFAFDYISPEVEDLLGYCAEEWLGSTTFWADHIHPEDRERAVRCCEEATARLEDHSFDYRMIAADGRVVWLRDVVNVVVENGKAVKIGGVMIDVTELMETADDLRYVSGMQGLMVEICRGLIRESDGDPERMLDEILARTGEWCRVDRTYFIRFEDDLSHFTNTHEWTAEGIAPEIENLIRVPSATLPKMMATLKRHQDMLIPDVDALPDSWRAERECFQPQGIKSLIVLPVFAGSQLIGMVGFDSVREHRRFTEEETALLRVLADVLGDAMARARVHADLRRNEQQRRSAERLARMGVWDWRSGSEMVTLSNEARRLIGVVENRIERRRLLSGLNDCDRKRIEQALAEAYRTGSNFDVECRFQRPDNAQFVFLRVHAEVADSDDLACCDRGALDAERIVDFRGYVQDITDRKEAEARLYRQAHYDALTGLPNWALLADRLEQALERAGRGAWPVALLVLDLDHFKKVNESLGHDVGDRLLRDAASRLSRLLGDRDTLARPGGDEFLILLEGFDSPDHPAEIARDIVQAFRRPFRADRRNLVLTVSIGLAMAPDDGVDPREMMRNADTAMYRAKGLGRDGLCSFDQSMIDAVSRQLRLEEALRGALQRQEIEIHYQPLIRLADRQLAGVEALMRWRHPELGNVSPGEFIPLAEQTGLIGELSDFLLQRVIADLERWRQRSDLPLTVSVNVSPRQFRNPDFVDEFLAVLDEAGVAHHALKIEITEGVLLSGIEHVPKMLNRLLEAGVGLSMDDFGTGYSSLSYLRDYPFTAVKIDQRFVRDVADDPKARQLVVSIIRLCDALGIEVVAEGVETEQQRQALADEGCDIGQGYLFSPAVPAAQIEAWLAGRDMLERFHCAIDAAEPLTSS
jgi:diguanylate cyclase (GGDEF)-like protein/PAS domain S-box-containing protein